MESDEGEDMLVEIDDEDDFSRKASRRTVSKQIQIDNYLDDVRLKRALAQLNSYDFVDDD